MAADSQEWHIDSGCIGCDVARQLAPGTTADRSGKTVMSRQPRDTEEERELWRAALACPVGAVRPPRRSRVPADVLPMRIQDEVYLCGFTSRETYGAQAYFVRRPEGNLLVDAPRWSRRAAAAYERLGGIAHILLTHRDHTAPAQRYARHFGARVWIHQDDADAARFATDVLRGPAPVTVQRGVVARPAPGHTAGSTLYLVDERFCFTGDTLYWSRSAGDVEVFESVVWYSRPELIATVRRLAAEARFEWILPGHGDRRQLPAGEMSRRLAALADRMDSRAGRALDIGAVKW
jgi:glyoxylase-like metal-dependent hydrolase (beta-lactamase superfamily II)